MKILLGQNNDISGYINFGIRKNLSEVIEDSSCDEILAQKYLDFIEPKSFDETVSMLCKKLKPSGKLILTGTDLFSIANLLVDGIMTLEQYRTAIYGDDSVPSRFICWTIDDVCKRLVANGVLVTEKFYNGSEFVIVGRKS